ncbi:hypothetical protein EDD18DRAFT_1109249 [Armillaria luteobubalina]|uniref:Uncharacterized protein n=1 Tax=Armillaria luteobubalina TaxID=153913 RepID=A0AA39UKW5_9AGAR|nr:hypothetical protein EDD18DRAFT_1109249 [Armillaria luteobubalina]
MSNAATEQVSCLTPQCLHDGTASHAVDILQYKSTSEGTYLITVCIVRKQMPGSPLYWQERRNGRQGNQRRLKTTGTFGSFGIIAFNAGSPMNYTKFEASVGTPAVAYTFENKADIDGPASSL